MCYNSLFDVIGSRYSISLEEFSSLTPRQIYNLILTIRKSVAQERSYEAALHDKKIKDNNISMLDEESFEVDHQASVSLDNLAKKDFESWPTIKN